MERSGLKCRLYGHHVVFFGKTLTVNLTLPLSAQVYTNLMLGITLQWTSISSGEGGGGES